MDGDPAEPAAKVEMEGRQIAESHKELAVVAQSPLVEERDQARGPISPSQRYYSFDFIVFEAAHHFLCPGLVRAGQVAGRFEYSRREGNVESHAFEYCDPSIKGISLFDRARRSNYADAVACFQGRRVDGGKVHIDAKMKLRFGGLRRGIHRGVGCFAHWIQG